MDFDCHASQPRKNTHRLHIFFFLLQTPLFFFLCGIHAWISPSGVFSGAGPWNVCLSATCHLHGKGKRRVVYDSLSFDAVWSHFQVLNTWSLSSRSIGTSLEPTELLKNQVWKFLNVLMIRNWWHGPYTFCCPLARSWTWSLSNGWFQGGVRGKWSRSQFFSEDKHQLFIHMSWSIWHNYSYIMPSISQTYNNFSFFF